MTGDYRAQLAQQLEQVQQIQKKVKGLAKGTAYVTLFGGTIILAIGISMLISFGDYAKAQSIVITVIGGVLMLCSYPFYRLILHKANAKIEPLLERIAEEMEK